MASKAPTELVFIAHHGRKRAPVTAEERKKNNSAVQKRIWQKKVLASAEQLRESSSAPKAAKSLICRFCQNSSSRPVPANSLIAAHLIRNGFCSNCGGTLNRVTDVSLHNVLDNNWDPFASFAVGMDPTMQRLLNFCESFLSRYIVTRPPA